MVVFLVRRYLLHYQVKLKAPHQGTTPRHNTCPPPDILNAFALKINAVNYILFTHDEPAFICICRQHTIHVAIRGYSKVGILSVASTPGEVNEKKFK